MSAAATGVVAGAIVWGREESINLFMSSVVGGASRGECAPPAVAESAFGDTTVAADKGSIGVNGPETIEGSELLSVSSDSIFILSLHLRIFADQCVNNVTMPHGAGTKQEHAPLIKSPVLNASWLSKRVNVQSSAPVDQLDGRCLHHLS